MHLSLTHRKATFADLKQIVALLSEDELGQTREQAVGEETDQRYADAFRKIDTDPNQYLMIVLNTSEPEGQSLVATCHLTILPSLTFTGSTRMQIEAVRVAEKYRGHKVGEWMMHAALDYARLNGATIVQLTTNKQRGRARQFYERLGFKATHEGMKLYLQT